jgi:hypothetical protein
MVRTKRALTLTARAVLATVLAATLLPASLLSAQERGAPRVGPLSSQVTIAVVEAWNAPTTQRQRGRFVVAEGDTIRRTLGVVDGPVIVSGTVLGDIVMINGDLRLDSTAVVQGSIVVVGGSVVGRSRGRVDGEMQVWRSALAYREVDGRMVADENETFFSRYAEWRKRRNDAFRDVLVSSAHTYNRVEGLSILAGPRLRLSRGASRATFEALGIFRTGDRLAWERRNLGHQLLAEFREGTDARHIAFGAQHVDEVAAVESWSLGDAETGLTSLLFARDYRDYYNRLGGSAFVRAAGDHGSQLQLSIGREEWESREARNPLALFRGGRDWRVNPGALEGTATLFGVKGVIDTRNDPLQPRDGWLLSAEYERGHVDITRAADTTLLALSVPEITYGRLFVDARRYNRVSPHSSVNLRLVAGGLLHGDALPAQRKLSVSGVDALPGYGFRSLEGDVDVGMCNVRTEADFSAAGRPAGCDAIMLLQAEWKGDFRIALFGANERTDARRWYADGLRADGTWIIFANSGRGWLVGDRDGELTYPRGSAPVFDGFRTDVGVGLDFGILGVYVAQPLQGDSNTPRVFVRLGARF